MSNDDSRSGELEPARHSFTTLELFLFSAASWHPHRIHFDQEYARSEGHEALLVHGPLQAVHLCRFLLDRLGGGTITKASYRHQAPVLAGVEVVLRGVEQQAPTPAQPGRYEVWMELADGSGARTTTCTVTVTS